MRRRQAFWRTRAFDGELGVELISRDEYNEWRSLQRLAPIAVSQDRAETDELVIDLTGLAAQLTDDAAVEPWRPVIGGNAAGFVTLLDADGVETPPAPAAINITAYEEHLDPTLLPDSDGHKRTGERAIVKTWASYWSFEAFEERRIEEMDHLSGGMAIVVHPRFDDDLEINNGAATLTLLPDGSAAVEINSQAGAVSVANPDPSLGAPPEVVLATISQRGDLEIVREASSTLDGGAEVLDDDAVVELVQQLEVVALQWRQRLNNSLSTTQEVEVVTLDFEFKTMGAGWPALVSDQVLPQRLVMKQARSLDPGLRGVPADVAALDVPRDVLARASFVERVTCGSGSSTSVSVEVTTDPFLPPELGYSQNPLVVRRAICLRSSKHLFPRLQPVNAPNQASIAALAVVTNSTNLAPSVGESAAS
jgi:hypothetical protein